MTTASTMGLAIVLAIAGLSAADDIRPHEVSTSAILAPNYDPDRPSWTPMAGSTTLFATGFEPGEGFTLGPINGQQGWTNFLDNNNIPAISDANPFAGSQHLRNSKGPGTNSTLNGALSPDFGPQPAGRYIVSVEFASNDAGGADHMLVGQAPSQGFLSWRIHFDWQNRIVVLDDLGSGLVFADTGHTWSPDGLYRNVIVELDYDANTIDYYYDGNLIYSSVAGVFAGTSIEQVVLFGDNWYTTGGWGDWDDLTVEYFPPSDIVALESDQCDTTGTLTVGVMRYGNGTDEIVGGQFFMLYDASRLAFVSADPASAPSPFTLEIHEFHLPGVLEYAVGVDHGQSGTTGDATMAVLTFDVLVEDCDVPSLVIFGPGDNKLSDNFGQPVVPSFDDLDVVILDQMPPDLAIPPDVTLSCEDGPWYAGSGDCAGMCGAQAPSGCWCDALCATFGDCCDGVCNDCATFPFCTAVATATDNCDSNPTVSSSDAIIPSGTCPQEFIVERTWIATDTCGLSSAPQVQLIEFIDNTAPTVSGVPSNIVVYSDAGICGAVVSWTPPTATDNCTDTVDIVVNSTHDPGDLFPVGVAPVVYSFTDECGNTSKVNFTVEVLPVSLMNVDVALQGAVADPFTRCIEFEMTDSDGNVISASAETLTFTSGQSISAIEVPCGIAGACVMARDPLHTLRETGTLSIIGTSYLADGFAPLRGGDLNDDGLVDILDFGVYVFTVMNDPAPGADTDCTTAGPHGDIVGDGVVFTADFTLIQINFLDFDEICPMTLWSGGPAARAAAKVNRPEPRRSVTVDELHRMGLEHLAIADLDGNGVIDENDIALFLAGCRP